MDLDSDEELESESEESSDNILELVSELEPESKVARFTLPFLDLLFFFWDTYENCGQLYHN